MNETQPQLQLNEHVEDGSVPLQPYQPLAGEHPYTATFDTFNNLKIGADWLPMEKGSMQAAMACNSHTCSSISSDTLTSATNIMDSTSPSTTQQTSRNAFVGPQLFWIGSKIMSSVGRRRLVAWLWATLQSWAIDWTTNRPVTLQWLSKSLQTKFRKGPSDTPINLYRTIEASDWRSVVVKEVNAEKKVTFEETKGSHVHCILRFISYYVNKYAYKKITKACNSRLKCSIWKAKARSDKNVKSSVPVTLPGSSTKFWLRHKQMALGVTKLWPLQSKIHRMQWPTRTQVPVTMLLWSDKGFKRYVFYNTFFVLMRVSNWQLVGGTYSADAQKTSPARPASLKRTSTTQGEFLQRYLPHVQPVPYGLSTKREAIEGVEKAAESAKSTSHEEGWHQRDQIVGTNLHR